MRNSRPDGNSIFGSPVYILDTIENWQIAIKSIRSKWRFVSITAEIVPNSMPLQLSVLNAYCLNGPVYIFDFLSISSETGKNFIKSIIENKEIFKVVYNLTEIGEWVWKSCSVKFVYTIDALMAYNISTNLPLTHTIHVSNFCSWIGKVTIPFLQEVINESQNAEYWLRRPIIYIMQCYLSGVVSVIMKAWLEIRMELTDDQVHSIFNHSKEVMANISGEVVAEEVVLVNTALNFKSSLSSLRLDKISIFQAFDKAVLNK